MTTAPASPASAPPTGPASRAAAAVVVAAVVAASVWSLWRFARETADVPAMSDVVAAAAFLRQARLGDDDVVLVAPPWSLHALQQLGEDGVGARLLPADGPWDVVHRGRHRRVFLWSEPDAAPWLAGRDHRVLAAPSTQTQAFGVLSVAAVDDTPARFDLLRRFDDLTVAVDGGAPCTEHSRGAGGGIRCSGLARGVRVAREWAQVTENSQPVVVVQPPSGRGLRLAIDGVTIADRLVVAAGHTRVALARLQEKKVQGDTVTVTVIVDDVVVGTLVRPPAFHVERHRREHVARFVGARDPDGGFTAVALDTRAVAGVNRRLSFVVATDLADDSVQTGIGLDAFVPGD